MFGISNWKTIGSALNKQGINENIGLEEHVMWIRKGLL
jgi:hypothetical protein